MEICLCDVNCGDCLLCCAQNRLLVVDCGARYGHRSRPAGRIAAQALQRGMALLQKKRPFAAKVLVLTSLDAAHYNGVLQLPAELRFDEICLPRYAGSQPAGPDAPPEGLVYRAAWAGAVALLTGRGGRVQAMQQLLLGLPGMLAAHGRVRCVAQGDAVKACGQQLQVLWPHPTAYVQRTGADLALLRQVLAAALQRTGAPLQALQRCLDAAHAYASAYLALYECYLAPQGWQGEVWQACAAALQTAYEGLLALPQLGLTRSEAGRSGSVTRALLWEMDAYSVVLDIPGQLLACGDITPDVMGYLRRMGRLSPRYRVAKLPGHGTAAYYSPALPAAEVGLVSNSGGYAPGYAISSLYTASGVERLCCTNANSRRCRIYNEGMTGQCLGCQIWAGGTDRLLSLKPGGQLRLRR